MRLLTTSPGAPSGLPVLPFKVYANAPASPTVTRTSSRAVTWRFSPAFIRLENVGSPSTVTDTQHGAFGAISILRPGGCPGEGMAGAGSPGTASGEGGEDSSTLCAASAGDGSSVLAAGLFGPSSERCVLK